MSQKVSPVVDFVAWALTWILVMAIVSFVNGVIDKRSLEAAFREWAFRTWWGAAIYVAGGVGFGTASRWIHMWGERRRKRKQQRDQSG